MKWEAALKEVKSPFLQYFGYAVQPLFKKDGSMLLESDFTIENIVKVKDDFYTFADKYVQDGEREHSKLKLIPGRLRMSVRNVEREKLEERYNVVNPAYLPVVHAKGGNRNSSSNAPTARELVQFHIAEDVVTPYTEYINALYIYPESINFTNYKGADCGAKNVLAGLKILQDDNSATERGLTAGYPFKPGHSLTEEVLLPVQYHQKKLKFLLGEEVKFELPCALTKAHNLVVTFYNIDTKKMKKAQQQQQRRTGSEGLDVLGHCILPLFKNEQMVVVDGKHSVPMLYQPPQRYLTDLESTDNKEYRWVDGRRLTFNFRAKLVSSVYPSDVSLNRFLRLTLKDLSRSKPLGSNDPDAKLSPAQKMEKLIRGLGTVSGYNRTLHFSLLAGKLLTLTREETSTLGRTAFRELLNTVGLVARDTTKKLYAQPVLESYIEYVYSAPPASESLEPVATALLCRIAEAMDVSLATAPLHEVAPQVAEYAWFLYGIAYKDMVLGLFRAGTLVRNAARTGRFPESLVTYIRRGVVGMADFVAKQHDPRVCAEANAATALFLRNLLNIMDRGVVYSLIYAYVDNVNKGSGPAYESAQACKFNFLRIIAAHEQYVQLILPKTDRIDSLETYDAQMMQDHFLSQLIIREAQAALEKKNAQGPRQMALSVVLELLHRHETDPDLENPICKTLVMKTYFPLVIALNNTLRNVFSMPSQDEKANDSGSTSGNSNSNSNSNSNNIPPVCGPLLEYKMWLVCLLEVVKYAGDFLRCWLPREKPRHIANFFRLLSHAAELFRYPGKDSCRPYTCEFLSSSIESTIAAAITAATLTAAANASTAAAAGAAGGGGGGSASKRLSGAPPPQTTTTAAGAPSHGSIGATGAGSGPAGGAAGTNTSLKGLDIERLGSPDRNSVQARGLGEKALTRKEVRSVILGKTTITRSPTIVVNSSVGASVGVSGSGSGAGSSHGGSDFGNGNDAGSSKVVLTPELIERPKTEGMMAIIPSSNSAEKKVRWAWVTSNRKDPAKRDFVAMAKNGLMEVSHIALNACLEYFNDCYDTVVRMQRAHKEIQQQQQQQQQQNVDGELTETGEVTLPAAISVVGTLLSLEQSDEFLPLLVYAASLTIKRYRNYLFTRGAAVCKELTYAALKMFESPCPTHRQRALSILCGMLACNQVVAKNVSLMKLQCTIVLSQFVGDKAKFRYTIQAFETIARYFGRAQTAAEVNDLNAKVREIVRNAAVLDEYSNDWEVIGSLYHGLSNGFLDSPDLRLAWLGNLAKHHLETDNREECAKTKTLMAALALKYVQVARPGVLRISVPDDAWARVLPNLAAETRMPSDQTLQALRAEICTGRYFTLEGFEELLVDAAEQLSAVSNYEQCIETRRILLLLYIATHDYQKQSAAYLALHQLCEKTAGEVKLPTRVPPNYYRVAFYGPAFGDMANGKQFIYKEPPFVRIADFTERIKGQFAAKGVKPEILPNSKPVDVAALSPDKSYLQIGAVTIVEKDSRAAIEDEVRRECEGSELEVKKLAKKLEKTMSEKHFGVDTFLMEMPFTKGKKSQGDLQDQWKRKITYVTDGAFPTVEKRLLIKSQSQEELPPVENAIALINDKIAALEKELSSSKPDTRTLQILLNGSLLAFVNAGPLEICKVFLGPDTSKLDPVPEPAQIDTLKKTMSTFSCKKKKNIICVYANYFMLFFLVYS